MEHLYVAIACAAIGLVFITRLIGWGYSLVLCSVAAAYWFYGVIGFGAAVLTALGLYLAFLFVRNFRGRDRSGLGSGPFLRR
jgi:hypothetical protein